MLLLDFVWNNIVVLLDLWNVWFVIWAFAYIRHWQMKLSKLQSVEDPRLINQWQMNSLDELGTLPIAATFGENLQRSFAHPNFNYKNAMETSHSEIDRPMKQHKANSWSSPSKLDHASTLQVASSPNFLSFANANYMNQMNILRPKEEGACPQSMDTIPTEILTAQGSFGNQNYVYKACQGAKRLSTSTRLSQTQDHIIAERKRREKLSQRFIALSAIVPGLKKVSNYIAITFSYYRIIRLFVYDPLFCFCLSFL